MANSMRIAVDAMGGDRGPAEVARGVYEAALHSQSHFYLVGHPDVLQQELKKWHNHPKNLEIVPASEVIEMTDQPAVAFRKKPEASVVVAARMVHEGQADAFVTIGNTGAAMAVGLLTLGRIKGIDRPAIATPLPSLTGGTVILLDAGATVDCDPNNLYEFALMGSAYAEHVLGVPKPRVALLSNGEEMNKGNTLVKRTHQLLLGASQVEAPFQFVGNVEGRDLFKGLADVVICDGFTGNVLLKTAEGVAEMVLSLVKQELGRHLWMRPLVAPFVPAMRRLRTRIDYAERGGAPLLGVNGICIIGHGRSTYYAVANACRAAEKAVEHNIVEVIRSRVCKAPLMPPAT